MYSSRLPGRILFKVRIMLTKILFPAKATEPAPPVTIAPQPTRSEAESRLFTRWINRPKSAIAAMFEARDAIRGGKAVKGVEHNG